jgi:uncharacterized protein with HEPN domain
MANGTTRSIQATNVSCKCYCFTLPKSRDDFDQDEDLRVVLTHWIQTIGEAARRVSGEFQREHPEVPWPAIIGMRHKIVHDYLSVDEDRVWRTATEELGELIDQLRALMPER